MNINVRGLRSVYPAVLLLWMLLSAWSVQAAPELAANVHFASGYVAATATAGTTRELVKGDDIYSGDRIETAENGRVQMRFTDGGLVSLMPGSTFSVDEYLYEDKAGDDASLVFALLRGGLRTVTGSIGHVQHDNYELKTPVATLGIRGTEYVAVLRPANTLRVHVGRGKVVITNDQGSLEVPEGRSAVVTLGSAPGFSAQGPQYQATGPLGDRLMAVTQYSQDPHLLNPRADMPPLGRHSFVSLPAENDTSEGPTPAPVDPAPVDPAPVDPEPVDPAPVDPAPVDPEPVDPAPVDPAPVDPTPDPTPVDPPPVETSYLMAAAIPSHWNGPMWFSGSDGINVEFEAETGILTSQSPDILDTGTWVSFNVGGNGALSWGEFTDGDGSLHGEPIALSSGQYMPYVIGSMPVNTQPAGMLHYSLEGATAARAYNTDGTLTDIGTLTDFDLGIDLGALTYTLDMNIDMVEWGPYHTGDAGVAGSLFNGSQAQGFLFDTEVQNSDNCNPACPMNVEGFLAGEDGDQAGVIYRIEGLNTDIISGAAGLRRP